LDPASTTRNGRGGANGTVGPEPARDGPLREASFTELIRRLINDLSELADKQIELAKQEIGEAKDEAISAIIKLAIGAGIALAAVLLVVIWAWTAVIWFFNWLGAFIVIGPISLAWLGWVVGIAVPALAAFIAYKRFISGGIRQARGIWPPLPRTRETLKEDLEWVRHQRIPSAR
jgi:uncharacterized membrane protein YqjE